MVRACDFGHKTQRGATSCETDFRAKRASVPDLAQVKLTLLMYMKTWCAHVILAKKHSAGQHRVKRTFGQNVHRYQPCSFTTNLAHVHENWAKTWCAHVILPKKHSAGQHRVKRTFGQNGHRYPTLLMYS